MTQQISKYQYETVKPSVKAMIDMYLDWEQETTALTAWLKLNSMTLADLGTPRWDKDKKLTGDIAESLHIEGDVAYLAPAGEGGVRKWLLVTKGTHILAIRWEGKASNKQSIGKLFIAFGTGGKVREGSSYPVYSWDGVNYRAYEYILKDTTSPGRLVYRKYKGGTYVENISWSNLVSDISGNK